MFAFNQSSGIRPVVKDWVNMTVGMGAISLAHSFNILVGMLSGPDALLGSRDSRSYRIPSHGMAMSGIEEYGAPLRVGMSIVFSEVNTDRNWLFKMFAFSLELFTEIPFTLIGGIPCGYS